MQNHHWLLDVVKEMDELSKENNLNGMMTGLQNVLETYAAEVTSNEEERQKVVTFLRETASQ